MAMDPATHLPPQNLEAEEALLGAMLMSSVAVEAAIDLRLRETDFYRPSHRAIFRVIIDLAERDAVDELTVINELRHRSRLAEAGGAAFIMSLAQRTPAIANARAYAEEVISQSTLRGLVDTGHEIARLGYEHPEDPPNLVDTAGALVTDLANRRDSSDFTDAAHVLHDVYEELAARAEGGVTKGLNTGFHDLDALTGGLHPGNLVILAARPGMGKTAWALNMAEHVALHEQGGVAVFSLEMTQQELLTRMLCSLAKVDQERVRDGNLTEHDWQPIFDATARLQQEGNLYIADTVDLTPMNLRNMCRRLHRQLKDRGGLRAVVVDYLQLMSPGRRFEGRVQEITYISRQLKSLALELQVPIIALSQLSRAVESRPDKRPQLSDLRESGSIEQDADLVLFLFRKEYYLGPETPPDLQGKGELIVAKNRHGRTNAFMLGWLGKYTRYVTLAKADQAAARQAGAGAAVSAAMAGGGKPIGDSGTGSNGGAGGSAPTGQQPAPAAPPAPGGGTATLPAEQGGFGPADAGGGGDTLGLPEPPPEAGYDGG